MDAIEFTERFVTPCWAACQRRALFLHRGNKADADELLQETYLNAWNAADQFRNDASPSTWLRDIMQNAFRNSIRDTGRKKRKHNDISIFEAEATVISTNPGPFESVLSVERTEAVSEAVERLPPQWLSVVFLRHDRGYTTKEIAETLGRPEPTVRTQLVRAHRTLSRSDKLRALAL